MSVSEAVSGNEAGKPEDRAVPHQADVTSAVVIRAVQKKYGAIVAIDGVDLSIWQGEFFSLLGPSGCGKTSLLRIIGGLEDLDSGQLLLDGRDVSGVPPYARNTNMIFQNLALFPHMNVFENVAFGLRRKGVARREIDGRVAEALRLVRLEGYGNRMTDQLSGGQRQRVAMARALINQPSVLLLDEPLGALDLQLRLQMQEELRRLHRALGNTFVFVTHDQGEAMVMSDRIAVMEKGQILQVGTPKEIYESPRTRFVASFIGHTNLLEGRIIELSGQRAVVGCGGLAIPCRAGSGMVPGQSAAVALRYEKVGLAQPGIEGRQPVVGGRVVDRSYLGGAVRLKVQIADGLTLTADLADQEQMQSIDIGDSVSLTFAPESAIVVAN
jgi:spermidine/putrescine transport system ATP-binding protein